MTLFPWLKKPSGPSPEAKAALEKAREIRDRADEVYTTRQQLLEHNHFAERIRLIYQGGRG